MRPSGLDAFAKSINESLQFLILLLGMIDVGEQDSPTQLTDFVEILDVDLEVPVGRTGLRHEDLQSFDVYLPVSGDSFSILDHLDLILQNILLIFLELGARQLILLLEGMMLVLESIEGQVGAGCACHFGDTIADYVAR